MIFVTVGSQKFQFDRLLKKIDEMIEKKDIVEEVFAQIGYSYYKPINYKYIDFLSQDDFKKMIKSCDLVITHAGTGAIISSLKNGKKVIAVPRLKKYGEHVDDHQIQLLKEFEQLELIEAVYEVDKLGDAVKKIKNKKYKKYISNTDKIINNIENFIND